VARRALDQDLRARGYELATPDDAVADGAREVTLEGPGCWALAAAGDAPVGEVEIAVFDRATELGRDRGRFAVVRLCPTHTGPVRVEVQGRPAGGAIRLSRWHWPRSTRGPFGLEGSLFVRLSEATSLLAIDGLEPLAAPTVVDLREGAPLRQRSPMRGCVAIVAAGAAEIRELEVGLGPARAAPRGPLAIVRGCATGSAAIEIGATRGSGRALWQPFGHAEAAPGP
jgi:hypothetical protein